MKTLISILICFVCAKMIAAIPPPYRPNPFTTNVSGTAVISEENISVTNNASGTNWNFFGAGPDTVARKRDITNAAIAGSFIATQSGYGTNTSLLDHTNRTGVYYQGSDIRQSIFPEGLGWFSATEIVDVPIMSFSNGVPTFTANMDFSPMFLAGLHMPSISIPSPPLVNHTRLYGQVTQGHTRLIVMDDDGIEYVLNRDNVFVARNTSGVGMTRGQAVYVTGATGNVPNIGLAKADSLLTLPAVGILVDTNLANNAFGTVMILGILSGVDTAVYSTGDRLFVSPVVAGAVTNARPVFPFYAQRMGSVLSSGVNGSVNVTTAPFLGGEESGTSAASFIVQSNATVFGNLNVGTNIFTTNAVFLGPQSLSTNAAARMDSVTSIVNAATSGFQPATINLTNWSNLPGPVDGISIQNFSQTNFSGIGWDGPGISTGSVSFVIGTAPTGLSETFMRFTGSGEYVRRLNWSNNWTRARVLALIRIPTNGPVGGDRFGITNVNFFFGFVYGTNSTRSASNTAHAIGFGLGNATANQIILSSNSVPRTMDAVTANSFRVVTITNGVGTDRGSGSGGSGNGFIAADPPYWTFLFFELSKPFGSQTNGVSYSLWWTAHDVSEVAFFPSYKNLVTEAWSVRSAAGAPGLEGGIGNMATVSFTYSEGQTAFDTLCLYWQNTNNVPLEVGGIMAARSW